MRRRSSNIILPTVAITGVLGASVAVAADPPSCPFGNTPKATQKAPARTGDQDRQQLRKRDGTARGTHSAPPAATSTKSSGRARARATAARTARTAAERPGHERRQRGARDCGPLERRRGAA